MSDRLPHTELLDAWRTMARARNLSPRTLNRRTVAFHSFERFHAPAHILEAQPLSIAEWLVSLPSPATSHAYRADMGQFFLWAFKRGLIPANPFEEVGQVKVPKRLPRPLPAAELTLVLDTADTIGLPYGVMLLFGALAGFRVSEIAAICWEEVNPEEGILVVRNGKGGKDRVVPLHPRLQALMGPPKPYGPVLLDEKGRPFTPESVGRAIAMLFRVLNIKATPHQLRHSFGTELARVCNGDLLLVATVMGHADLATTIGYTALHGGRAKQFVKTMWDTPPAATPASEPVPDKRLRLA